MVIYCSYFIFFGEKRTLVYILKKYFSDIPFIITGLFLTSKYYLLKTGILITDNKNNIVGIKKTTEIVFNNEKNLSIFLKKN